MAKNVFDTIAGYEGLILKPKYDVNHYRIGYGSDTYTTADGKVHTVTKNTKAITAEDAVRDLNRRIKLAQADVINQIGQDSWDKLDDAAKIAATDTAYNYGSIGELSTLKKALKANDNESIAKALEKYKTHNNSINARRRQEMADLVRGGEAGSAEIQTAEADPMNPDSWFEDPNGTGFPNLLDASAYADVKTEIMPPGPRPRPKTAPVPRNRPITSPIAPTPMPGRPADAQKPQVAPQPRTPSEEMTRTRELRNPTGRLPSDFVVDNLFTLDPPPIAGQQDYTNAPNSQPQRPQVADKAIQATTKQKEGVKKTGSWANFPVIDIADAVGYNSGFDKQKFAEGVVDVLAPTGPKAFSKPRESGIAPAPQPGQSKTQHVGDSGAATGNPSPNVGLGNTRAGDDVKIEPPRVTKVQPTTARKVKVETIRPDGTKILGDDSVAGVEEMPVSRPKVPYVPATAVQNEREQRLEQNQSRAQLNPVAIGMVAGGALPATTLPTLSIDPLTPESMPQYVDPPNISTPEGPKTLEGAVVKRKEAAKQIAKQSAPKPKLVSNLTSSGRTKSSVGESFQSVWDEARG